VAAIGWFLSGLAMQPIRESYQRLKQFTADASHELRNPIAIIQTNVQVALSDPEPDLTAQQHHLQVIERLTRRLGRLVDDLLFLARQDSGIAQSRTTQVDLNTVLVEVVEEQQAFAQEKGVALSFEQPITSVLMGQVGTQASTPVSNSIEVPFGSTAGVTTLAVTEKQANWSHLLTDRDQMTRLFTNLISNALQYTPSEGKVMVKLQQTGRPGQTSLQVIVQDTGIGIPANRLPQIFERFYRVDPARSHSASAGSGLGLAIARAIVENHRGQIQLESVPTQGTTVTVMLPQRIEESAG
jgi:OmpR-family two-component system manganese-sensing sensor histidine kinase